MNIRLAPSILSADFAALGDAIRTVERAGADQIHLDVMDGHFVPNLTMGPAVVRAVRRTTRLPLDVHLMISEPDRYLGAFAEAGGNVLIVHAEVLPHLHRTLGAIRQLGCKAGVALNPSTPPTVLEEVAGQFDVVLVMTVNPGFGGQAFIESSESKIVRVRELLERTGSRAAIEVDGGIDRVTVARVVRAGAEILVAGAAIFEAPNPGDAARELRALAVGAAGGTVRS